MFRLSNKMMIHIFQEKEETNNDDVVDLSSTSSMAKATINGAKSSDKIKTEDTKSSPRANSAPLISGVSNNS